MIDSEKLIDDLIRDEGLRLYVYDDATGEPIVEGSTVQGNPTIGIGRLLTQEKGISKREAKFLCHNDIQNVEEQLDHYVPWWADLNESRRRALVNMTFNLGIGSLLTFEKMLAALKERRWEDAAREARDSLWAKQVPNRAARVIKLLKGE